MQLYVAFHFCHGNHLTLSSTRQTAERDNNYYDNGIAFSSLPLNVDDIFEVYIILIENSNYNIITAVR